jgi:hypothetical protein
LFVAKTGLGADSGADLKNNMKKGIKMAGKDTSPIGFF